MEPLVKNNFGTRLKYARKMAGMSLQNLADQLNNIVTKQALNKYEQGLMLPTSEVLLAISQALNVKQDYFLKKFNLSIQDVSFRKKANFSLREEEKVIEKARDYVERFLEIENIIGIQNVFVNPVKDLIINDNHDAEKAAIRLREIWELGKTPITGLIEMLELKGVKVLLLDETDQLDGFSFITADGIPVVAVNSRNKPIERLRFTIIHEFAHIILNLNDNLINDKKATEVICHRFSSCLLLPGDLLLNMIGNHKRNYIEIRELMKIKEYYGISIRAIVHRLKEMQVITPVYYQKWMVYMSKTYGAKDEPGNFKGEEKPKEMEVIVNRALTEGLISLSKAAVILDTDINDLRKGLANVR